MIELTKSQEVILSEFTSIVDSYLAIGDFYPKVLVDPLVENKSMLDYSRLAKWNRSYDKLGATGEFLTFGMALPRASGKTVAFNLLEQHILDLPYAKKRRIKNTASSALTIITVCDHTIILADECYTNIYDMPMEYVAGLRYPPLMLWVKTI